MGYAPNDRIELLEKETEIKNKSLIIAEWFGTIYLIYTVTLLLVLPAAVIVDIYRTVEGVPEFEVNNIFYFFWFLFLYIALPISLQVFFIPLLFINTYICAQVYLIISKLRPEYDGDDLYEVIEGSEGSSTKKTDD
ncbi:hypothetical protein GCK72_021483 [Caenorhabditis remanei]|uniref:Uncharacterized protein n=1 Tax=Caenorhabditis remanei TaxID=31234 RepID=A0A6A5GIA4_CAERE|nr:hypothetical protein GCK72_021483 [Caenorhabditis remanei]KAF1754918.1 hypothetical protein GCK72_021483 [Caenorhabditis remanei]